jgi:hypothetical protein
VRCRQLVAAYTTKLHEKEAEVRAGRELRDQQLGCVLRALLMLEARLRREQRHIRQQLSDRDNVIHTQQLEIARLRKVRAGGRLAIRSSCLFLLISRLFFTYVCTLCFSAFSFH